MYLELAPAPDEQLPPGVLPPPPGEPMAPEGVIIPVGFDPPPPAGELPPPPAELPPPPGAELPPPPRCRAAPAPRCRAPAATTARISVAPEGHCGHGLRRTPDSWPRPGATPRRTVTPVS
jgi:hypothetical protein